MMLGQLDIHKHENRFGFLSNIIHKNEFNIDYGLNVRLKVQNLLEENRNSSL